MSDDTNNNGKAYIPLAEYLGDYVNGESQCELCGHLLQTTDGKAHNEVQSPNICEHRVETLHWLWHLTKQHPDRCYIMLARIIGGLSGDEISRSMAGRTSDPTTASISMLLSSLADDIVKQVGDNKQVQALIRKQLGHGKLKIHSFGGRKKNTKKNMQQLCTGSLWDCM